MRAGSPNLTDRSIVMITFRQFKSKFKFDRNLAGRIGVEREAFLVKEGKIVPISPEVLKHLPQDGKYGYELSACQLEDRVGPVYLFHLREALLQNEREIKKVERKLGFQRLYQEVGPPDMPLDVYPDPTGRYERITKNMPRHILSAACRVTGIHIHIGMPDHRTALAVYNKAVDHYRELCRAGDGSKGERLKIYRTMAPDYQPRSYGSWKEFYDEAIKKGFAEDPRKCWHLIRMSVHGTIEFRMFGATDNLGKIEAWAVRCSEICEALNFPSMRSVAGIYDWLY